VAGVDIAFRISGVGHQTPGFETLLREAWGYSAARDGNDYVVLAGDPAFKMPSKSVLRLHGPLSLMGSNVHKLAGKLFSWIPTELNAYFAEHAKWITIDYNENSVLNRAYACRARLAGYPQDQVRAVIRDELLPLMRDMGATKVYGVTIDVSYQQSIYTSVKFGFLLEDYDLPTVEKLISEQRALAGIAPYGLNPLWYLDALTRLAPIAATLPIERGNCAWHFVAPSSFVFKHSVLCEGLFQQFMGSISPLSEKDLLLPADSMRKVMTSDPDSFLKVTLTAVNNIMSFANDLRNFVIEPGNKVDFAKQIQTFGAIDLLFSDIISLNHSTSGYHRINCSINVLDKLANFLKCFGTTDKESAIFKTCYLFDDVKCVAPFMKNT
jgi:hypothetical protein